MKNYLLIITAFLLISNCNLNKVIKHHGVNFLDKKEKKLEVNKSNKNDIIEILGPPSTQSTFDNDLWIYIERATSSSKLLKLGNKTLIRNNVLVLEINNQGVLTQKIFFDKDDMEKIKFSEKMTTMTATKRSFVYEFLNSMRQKINDPLGKKKIQN